MSYNDALEAAGAEVLEYKSFGDYQGTWIAFLKYNGEYGFVTGSYGSCSGCDSFQAEFGYENSLGCAEHLYRPNDNCINCSGIIEQYKDSLSNFGKIYLDGLYSHDQIKSNIEYYYSGEWNNEERNEMISFINSHKRIGV